MQTQQVVHHLTSISGRVGISVEDLSKIKVSYCSLLSLTASTIQRTPYAPWNISVLPSMTARVTLHMTMQKSESIQHQKLKHQKLMIQEQHQQQNLLFELKPLQMQHKQLHQQLSDLMQI